MALLFFLLFLFLLSSLLSLSSPSCHERCGPLGPLPFPFHVDPSCGPPIPIFRLTCVQNSTLFLGPTRVLSFPSSSTLLLDYSANSSSCARWYADLSRSDFNLNNNFLSISQNNVLRLYDCEDSSICRSSGCEEEEEEEDEEEEGNDRGCCYPLSDGSVWKAGDGFGVFKEFGCRGFSSWRVPRDDGDQEEGNSGSKVPERGIEMEWAVMNTRGGRNGTECAAVGAVEVNATGVKGGVRCACGLGFVGDGFANGDGCFKSCNNDSNTTYHGDCCKGRFCKKKVAVLIGLLVSIFFIAAATTCYFLLRSPSNKRYRLHPEQTCLPKFFAKACRTRLFTYQELNEATKGFDQDQKLIDLTNSTIYPGVLSDETLVAVQRMRCGSQQNLKRVINKVEFVSQISHKNIAQIIGFCISSTDTLLVVHEFFPNGTLEDLLQSNRENGPLNWYRRITMATEIASALAHLQSDISPPIKPHNLKSSDVFILPDYSVKIASFKLLASHDTDVVYNFGLILLELIVGSKSEGVEEMVLDKIKDGKFHEIVDPGLRFDEQLPVQCKQIENIAIFAVHCLSRKGLCMVGAAKEFIRIVNDNMDGSGSQPALEVTFSNSSLLQMISVSPDSFHLP